MLGHIADFDDCSLPFLGGQSSIYNWSEIFGSPSEAKHGGQYGGPKLRQLTPRGLSCLNSIINSAPQR